jgi:UDP-glucose 4-epimerase
MKILVTGGAGYIGSATVKKLTEQNHQVVVLDNLSKGKKELIDKQAELKVGDLIDKDFVNSVFQDKQYDAVMHFAAYKAAGESMEQPIKYSDNISGFVNLLNAIVKNDVEKVIFSSTAAVYGEPQYAPVDEKHPLDPQNFYGYTKLAGENLIKWYSDLRGVVGISLRYFNVAGDAGLNYIDPEAQNVFPIIMEALTGTRDKFEIFGDDYDTPDGTCIRDYIGINDLVDAHIKALDLNSTETINLGTSKGVSVLELVKKFSEIYGKELLYEIGPRRDGDVAKLTASYKKASTLLNWKPKETIKDMVEDTINAYK